MASIVIGIPIDETYLRSMSEYKYKRNITQADMAKVARERPNDEGKETLSSKILEDLKKECKGGKNTMCMVYNATGADLTYVLHHDWRGHIFEKEFPVLIGNGQWTAWLHVSEDNVLGSTSTGAVVYRGTNTYNTPKDWLQCWEITETFGDNLVYTEVGDEGDYANADWDHIHTLFTPKKSTYVGDVCSSEAVISNGNSAVFTAIMGIVPLPN